MRVVIVQPPIEDFYLTPHRLSALGGFSVKALLEKQGQQVSLINFPLIAKKGRYKPLPSYGTHLLPYLRQEKGPISYFTRWNRWGPDSKECAIQILSGHPDVVLFSLFAWAYGQELLDLAKAVKNLSPETIIMTGGAGISVSPGFFARSSHIDLVLQGEGESLFKEHSLESLREMAIRQVRSCSESEKIISSQGFCSGKEIEPIFSLTTGGKTHSQASTVLSRGCPRLCRFCSNHLTQGRNLRRIPLDLLEESFGIWLTNCHFAQDRKLTLDLEDDNLLMDKDYLILALNMFRRVWQIKGYSRENLFFTAENGLDYSLLNLDFLDILIKEGFRQFNFSLASVDRGVLSRENRFFAPEKLNALLQVLKKRNIPGITYFICGLDNDSPESISRALVMTGDLPSSTGISLYYPVPGLEGFELNQDLAGSVPGLCRGSMAYPWTGSLTTQQMITAFRLSRFTNLLKSEEADKHDDLIKRIFKTRELHSYDRQGKIIPLPRQDGGLVQSVLDYFSR